MPSGVVFGSLIVIVVAAIIAYKRYYASNGSDQTPVVPADDHTDDIQEEPREIPEDFVSSACVTRLRNANIKTLCHLRELSEDDLTDIDYIGEKRAKRIQEEIESMDESEFFRRRQR